MAELGEVRTALADAIAGAVPGMKPFPLIPDSITLPAVVVQPGSPFADYSRRFGGGTALYRLEPILLVGRTAEISAQKKLDGWVSPTGPVITALHTPGQTLGGLVQRLSVTSGQSYGPFLIGESAVYFGASLLVEIEA